MALRVRPLAAGAGHRGRQPRLLLGPDGVGCHLSPARGLEPGPAVHPPSPARHRWARPPAVAVGSERRTEEHTQVAEDTLLRPESSSRRNLRRARGRFSSSGFSLTFLRPSKITTTTTATHSPVRRTLKTFSSVMVRPLLKPSTDFPLQMPNVPRLRLGPPGPRWPAWRAPRGPPALPGPPRSGLTRGSAFPPFPRGGFLSALRSPSARSQVRRSCPFVLIWL